MLTPHPSNSSLYTTTDIFVVIDGLILKFVINTHMLDKMLDLCKTEDFLNRMFASLNIADHSTSNKIILTFWCAGLRNHMGILVLTFIFTGKWQEAGYVEDQAPGNIK